MWLQESPRAINPVIAIAALRRAQPQLQEMGGIYLDCAPVRGYTELTARVSVLTLMPSSFAFDTLPSLLQNGRMMRQRPGYQQLYYRFDLGRSTTSTTTDTASLVPTSSTATTTAMLVPDTERGARALGIFDKPVRLFICAPDHHIESATLHGDVYLEDVAAQLCIQLADAHRLQAGWVIRASERVVSDADFGFTAFFVTVDTSRRDTAWIDGRRLGFMPFAIPLPFTLTRSSLDTLCRSCVPAGAHIAINGVPWCGTPARLRHTDVVVVGLASHDMWTVPLAALEPRISGISCLIIHQKGPRPTGRLVAFDDAARSGSSRRVFDFTGMRTHWANVRMAWQVETCQVENTQRSVLVAADIPPFPVGPGLGVAPTATLVNLWYHSRFSQLFGDRTWRESGLAFGEFSIFFDESLDSTSRRPWIIDLGYAVDVVIAGSDGSGLERWPAPEGWAIRPSLITGPIGQAAIQRAAGGMPTVVFQPLPGQLAPATAEPEEIASASSDDDVEVVHVAQPVNADSSAQAQADPATAAYLQSLIDDPPTTEQALSQFEEEDSPHMDANPFD